jgi:hypothetical protein
MEFTDLLDEHGVAYHVTGAKCTQGWVNFTCPWCMRDPYMGYNIQNRYVSCWNCGYHPLGMTLRLLTGLSLPECFRLTAEFPRLFLGHKPHTGRYKEPPNLEPLTTSGLHRDYLANRGLWPAIVSKMWGVRAIGPLGGRMKWRLWIPIHLRGEIVSWTTRHISPENPLRYLNAPDEESSYPVSDLLYGIDHARCAIIVVEGPVDVWKIGPGAVATLGTNVTPTRLLQIARFPYRVVCFDNEPDAQVRAKSLCKELSMYPGTTKNVTLDSKDPGFCTPQELDSLRRLIL